MAQHQPGVGLPSMNYTRQGDWTLILQYEGFPSVVVLPKEGEMHHPEGCAQHVRIRYKCTHQFGCTIACKYKCQHPPYIRDRLAVSAISENVCSGCLRAEQNAGQERPVNTNTAGPGLDEFGETILWIILLAIQVLHYDPLALPGYPGALSTATWNNFLTEKPHRVHIEAILIEEPMLDDLNKHRFPIPAHFRPSRLSNELQTTRHTHLSMRPPCRNMLQGQQRRAHMNSSLQNRYSLPYILGCKRWWIMKTSPRLSCPYLGHLCRPISVETCIARDPWPSKRSPSALPWNMRSRYFLKRWLIRLPTYSRPICQIRPLHRCIPKSSSSMCPPRVSPTISPLMLSDDSDLTSEDKLDNTNVPNGYDWLDESTWTSAANPRPPGRETKLIMLDY
ncbi:uncharacterized protein F5Z01DRAFT_338598 [Emericellopsis atlantica]|uniref:Uncharacterized protein n=1 Tax=Emericellopsis atlantica TaxID=2614577 RepID=A0A9P8CLF3_9HYPO|nr:uncharacterized protein F5Z01DRAFT_338598 [Emericellopsis atlantica]KAG9250950.1 hypothetical protein F5Z01DRAFT_338598 [Emericellopsis atlantica]